MSEDIRKVKFREKWVCFRCRRDIMVEGCAPDCTYMQRMAAAYDEWRKRNEHPDS